MRYLRRHTPPAEPALTLLEAKDHARIQHPDEDVLLSAYIQSVIDELDGVNGWLGRALVTQTWDLVYDGSPSGDVTVPLPPLQSIESVVWTDADDDQHTIGPADYTVLDSEPAVLRLTGSWPRARKTVIRFVCGYGTRNEVPEAIRQYIRYRVATADLHREMIAPGSAVAPIPWVRDSLESFRVRGVL